MERFVWLYNQYILVGIIYGNFHHVRIKYGDINTGILQCARGAFYVLCRHIRNILQEQKIRTMKSAIKGRCPYKIATAGQNPPET
jgi:hypothetical protein